MRAQKGRGMGLLRCWRAMASGGGGPRRQRTRKAELQLRQWRRRNRPDRKPWGGVPSAKAAPGQWWRGRRPRSPRQGGRRAEQQRDPSSGAGDIVRWRWRRQTGRRRGAPAQRPQHGGGGRRRRRRRQGTRTQAGEIRRRRLREASGGAARDVEGAARDEDGMGGLMRRGLDGRGGPMLRSAAWEAGLVGFFLARCEVR